MEKIAEHVELQLAALPTLVEAIVVGLSLDVVVCTDVEAGHQNVTWREQSTANPLAVDVVIQVDDRLRSLLFHRPSKSVERRLYVLVGQDRQRHQSAAQQSRANVVYRVFTRSSKRAALARVF